MSSSEGLPQISPRSAPGGGNNNVHSPLATSSMGNTFATSTSGHLTMSGSEGGMSSTKDRLKAIELEISRLKSEAESARDRRRGLRSLERGWESHSSRVHGTVQPGGGLSAGGFKPEDLALTLSKEPHSARLPGEDREEPSLRVSHAPHAPKVPPKGMLIDGEYNLIPRRKTGKKAQKEAVDRRRQDRLAKERERQDRLRREIELDKAQKEAAAVRIQCAWRQQQARAHARYLRDDKEFGKPARAIQRLFRGYRARCQAEILRRERAEQIAKDKEMLLKMMTRIDTEGANYEFDEDELIMIREQFNRVDTDGSGDIDRREFTVFYNNVSLEEVARDEAQRIFDELDADGSGKLGFDEFVQLYALILERERAKRDPNGAQRVRDLDQRIKERAALLAKWREEEKQRKAEYEAQKKAEYERLRKLFGKAKMEEIMRQENREDFFKRRREEAARRREEDEKMIRENRERTEIQQFLARAEARAKIKQKKKSIAAGAGRKSVAAGSPLSPRKSVAGGGMRKSVAAPESPSSALLRKSMVGFDDTMNGNDSDDEEFNEDELEVLRSQFNRYDVDKSGEISRDEFHLFYNSVALKTVTEKESDKLFRQLDTDGSGGLSFEQFIHVYTLVQKIEAYKRDPNSGQRLQKLQERLHKKAEALQQEKKSRSLMRQEHAKRMAIEERERKMKHDGVVEDNAAADAREELLRRRHEEARRRREENERIVAITREKEEIQLFLNKAAYRLHHNLQGEPFTEEDLATLRDQFDRFDVDGSGDISADEFEIFYNTVSLSQLSEAECRDVFRECDTDNSGALTFNQFVMLYDMLQLREAASRDPAQRQRYEELKGSVLGSSTRLDGSFSVNAGRQARRNLNGSTNNPPAQATNDSVPQTPNSRSSISSSGGTTSKAMTPHSPNAVRRGTRANTNSSPRTKSISGPAGKKKA